jgi:hypothetical protein
MSFAFGRFQVLPHRRQLLADGQPIKLAGRAFDILMTLLETPGAVVDRDTLVRLVWPGRIVEENVLWVQVSVLRTAIGAEPTAAPKRCRSDRPGSVECRSPRRRHIRGFEATTPAARPPGFRPAGHGLELGENVDAPPIHPIYVCGAIHCFWR